MFDAPWATKARLDDRSWWTDVMRSAGLPEGSQVATAHHDLLGGTPGTSSTIERVLLGYDGPVGEAPGQVIVKRSKAIANTVDEGSRDDNALLGPMWTIEVGFYETVAPHIATRTPACWYGEASPDGYDGLIVMEDYGSWGVADQHDGLDAEEMDAAVDAVAALHAWAWEDVERDELGWLPSGRYVLAAQMTDLWPAVRDLVVPKLPELASIGDEIYPRYPELLALAADRRHCVIDGDFRADNLRMARGPDGALRVAVLDFQMAGRGIGAHDIARIMADSPAYHPDLDEHRRVCERWRRALVERGVTGYEADEAWFDYQLGLALVLHLGVLVELLAWDDARNAETNDRIAARMLDAAQACGSVDFVRDLLGPRP